MKYDDPCDDHCFFQWDCQECKNVRQRSIYNNEVKNVKKYCKYCKKKVCKVTFEKHRKTKTHRLCRKIAKMEE
jgi:hypothetical protein